jgi:SRSO17 transposase
MKLVAIVCILSWALPYGIARRWKLSLAAGRHIGRGDKALLIIDDTALPKKGKLSVGVAPRYATVLGRNANCQTLVSMALASGEVPVMLSLRLFLPESWTSDVARIAKAHVPAVFQAYRTKPEIATEEIDRAILRAFALIVCVRIAGGPS